MKVLEISLFLILTWAAQESQGGAPMEKTCCSEPDGCGDDYMCGKKTILLLETMKTGAALSPLMLPVSQR